MRSCWIGLALLLLSLAPGARGAPEIAPFKISPLGDHSQYQSLTYSSYYDGSIRSKKSGSRPYERQISGRYWSMRVPNQTDAAGAEEEFAAYITSIGGELEYRGSPYSVYTVPGDDDQITWYARFRALAKRSDLAVYAAERKEVGQAIKLTLGKDQQKVAFELNNPGGRVLRATLEAPPGAVRIKMTLKQERGVLSRNVAYKRSCSGVHARTYQLDDLPQYAGNYRVFLSRRASEGPAAITLNFLQGDPIASVAPGEGLGGIRIEDAAYGPATVEPEGNVLLTHPEFTKHSLRGDSTPEGAAELLLPPGYWKLRVSPEGYPGMAGIETRMVPVHSGKQTIVSWPRNLAAVFGSGDRNGIRISGVEPAGETVAMRFRLQGEELAGVEPTLDNLSLRDGGAEGKILEITAHEAAADIVLLLDSSGSMKGQMRPALDAARRFIQGLPPGAKIRVVDFDTKVKVLPGTDAQKVLSGLETVKARGATALYDAVVKGLSMLAESRRPTLLLFTDGVDANWNDTGPGSKATRNQVMKKVRATDVPMFTIGFGAGHDQETLGRLAALSGGLYFGAGGETDLDAVYRSIHANVVKSYRLKYRRPTKTAPSDVPVVHFVVDNSGSMGNASTGDQGVAALEVVREVLRGFVNKLPANAMTALQTFTTDSGLAQVLTYRRTEFHRALGTMTYGGGTSVFDALQAAVDSLTGIPSTNRTLVLVTDSAMNVASAKKRKFNTLLGRLKDAGVRCLFVGVGIDTSTSKARKELPFRQAAEGSGGAFIVSEAAGGIQKTFDDLGAAIAAAEDTGLQKTSLRLSLRHRTQRGKVLQYTGARLERLPPLAVGEEIAVPGSVRFRTVPLPPRYDAAVAATVGGSSTTGRDFVVARKLRFGIKQEAAGLKISAPMGIILSKLRGVVPRSGTRLLALPLELTATGTEAVIFDPGRELVLRQNFQPSPTPLSSLTWLTEDPLTTPDRTWVEVPAGQTVTGTALFEVRDEPLQQLSLHLLKPGAAATDLFLMGEGSLGLVLPPGTPVGPPADLARGTKLVVTSFQDQSEVEGFAAGDGRVFRVVDFDLTAKTPVVLGLDPIQSMTLALPTAAGELVIPPHDVSARLPFAFTRAVRVAPGRSERLRLAYHLPQTLAKGAEKGVVLAQAKRVPVVLPLTNTPHTGTASKPGWQVNAAEYRKSFEGSGSSWILVDLSVADARDGAGIELDGPWRLRPTEGGADLEPDPRKTREKLFAWRAGARVQDGRKRRGVLLFRMPGKTPANTAWTLVPPSPLGEARTLALAGKISPTMLTEGMPYEHGFRPRQAAVLRKALAASAERLARRSPPASGAPPPAIRGPGRGPRPVAVPPINQAGTQRLQSVKDLEALADELRFLPSPDGAWGARYEPEAILTQGWGTAAGIAQVAERVLARRGVEIRRTVVEVTEAGRLALAKRAGLFEVSTKVLPALEYVDAEGLVRRIVSPFLRLAHKLPDLVGDEPELPDESKLRTARVRLEVVAEPIAPTRAGMLGGLNAGLTGKAKASKPKTFTLATFSAALETFSQGAIDLGYTLESSPQGPLLRSVVEAPWGRTAQEAKLNLKEYRPVEEILTVRIRGKDYRHRRTLGNNDDIAGTFRTLGVNLPDLPPAALAKLDNAWKEARAGVDKTDDVTALRWWTRGILARFVGEQTRSEREVAAQLKVIAGRTSRPRILVVTVTAEGEGKSRTTLDLIRTATDLHTGSLEAQRSFRVITGIRDTLAEGAAVPGGASVFDAWQALPAGAQLHWITRKSAAEARKKMSAAGLPSRIIKQIHSDRSKAFLFPTHTAEIAGAPRWAWLEVDMKTYETAGVFGTGERGAMIEFSIGNWSAEALSYVAGGLVGISASMWSMSSYSIPLSDRTEILRRAKALALSVGNHFEAGKSIAAGGLSGAVGVPVGGAPRAKVSDGVLAASWSGGKITVGQDMLGFGQGYAAGVEYYFSVNK